MGQNSSDMNLAEGCCWISAGCGVFHVCGGLTGFMTGQIQPGRLVVGLIGSFVFRIAYVCRPEGSLLLQTRPLFQARLFRTRLVQPSCRFNPEWHNGCYLRNPTASSASSSYTVTATNASGTTTAVVTISAVRRRGFPSGHNVRSFETEFTMMRCQPGLFDARTGETSTS